MLEATPEPYEGRTFEHIRPRLEAALYALADGDGGVEAHRIRIALDGLAAPERTALLLRYRERATYERIGVRLHCSGEQARRMVDRGLYAVAVQVWALGAPSSARENAIMRPGL